MYYTRAASPTPLIVTLMSTALNKSISITVDKAHLEDVCGAILHALLFQRTLGNLKPKELTVLDIPVPAIDNASIEQVVAKHARELSITSADRGILSLVLSENKSKKVNHWFGFGEQEHTEQVPWECWIVNFNILVTKSENRGFRCKDGVSANSHTDR